MKDPLPEHHINELIAKNDKKNLAAIARAKESGKINDEAREYLDTLYSDGMYWFRQIFYILGKCFGAPKAAVSAYDYEAGCAIDEYIKIADINPMVPYIVNHRLDADPMRNQFFSVIQGHKVELSVSSIVCVIIGAQKKIDRSLEKIIDDYYAKYVEEVASVAQQVIAGHDREASGRAIADKIRKKFSEKYISQTSETVLGIIGHGFEKIAVELVRELDKIAKPHLRLRDVWRAKCLFDLIPQARTFIERIRELSPERIISVRDTFFNVDNPRNYRDAKIILNIGTPDKIIPFEIICQVRTLFEFERRNHEDYAKARNGTSASKQGIEKRMAEFMGSGINEYNTMICACLDDLFERVGWNILYSQGNGVSLFDGFPKIANVYYPPKIVDIIIGKVENAVENEVFKVPNAPAKLTKVQESEIFRWMAKFILVSAMPYTNSDWELPSDDTTGKFFNFVMKELQRYYKK